MCGAKGLLSPARKRVLTRSGSLSGLDFCQVGNFVLHGVETCQEDRLLVFLPFLEHGYQEGAMYAALRDEFVLPEAGGIVLQAGRVRVGYGELVGADGAGFLGLFPASCKARG